MTEKKIFAYKLFLSLNSSDFNIFVCENCNPPPENSHHSLSQQPSLKVYVLSSPSHFENLVGGSTPAYPPPSLVERGGGGAHYASLTLLNLFQVSVSW